MRRRKYWKGNCGVEGASKSRSAGLLVESSALENLMAGLPLNHDSIHFHERIDQNCSALIVGSDACYPSTALLSSGRQSTHPAVS
jgi:hypothetical protein